MNPRLFLLILLSGTLTLPAAGQDDRPWWRQLLGPEEAPTESVDVAVPDSMGAEPTAKVPMSEEPVMAADEDGENVLDSVASTAIPAGSVSWSIPAPILALDSAKAGPDEIQIPGFRVQLFMGRLDSARALRQALLEEEEWAWPTYVTPYPPLFAVTLGNFTEKLAAMRLLDDLKRRFPTGLVVPLSLPLDALYPVGTEDARGPEIAGPHRD